MQSYREKLSPSVWLMIAIGLVIPATALIFLPVNLPLGVFVGLALWAGAVGILWWNAPALRVTDTEFHAGRAVIELAYLSGAEAFTQEDARAERGVKLDARAFLAIRPWLDGVVKVSIDDPLDPTPYWLVSSKNPVGLTEALERARTTTSSTPGTQTPT